MPLPENSHFIINKNGGSQDYIMGTGAPATAGVDDVALWLEPGVDLTDLVGIRAAIDSLSYFIKANWDTIPPNAADTTGFHGPVGDCRYPTVSQTPAAGNVALYIGDNIYNNKNSNHLLGSVRILKQALKEETSAN